MASRPPENLVTIHRLLKPIVQNLSFGQNDLERGREISTGRFMRNDEQLDGYCRIGCTDAAIFLNKCTRIRHVAIAKSGKGTQERDGARIATHLSLLHAGYDATLTLRLFCVSSGQNAH